MGQNLIVVLVGETGSGKSFISRELLPKYPNVEIITKYTTRKPRLDEKNVRDVHAGLTIKEVMEMDYHYMNCLNGEHYGLKKEEFDRAFQKGKIPFVDISNEKAYLSIVRDYPNQVLLLKVVPYFEEDTMKETFERQKRDPKEFEQRKSALQEPLTDWTYQYDNMREVVNPYFLRNIPKEISANVLLRRLESVIGEECNANLGASLAKVNDGSNAVYKYLYYYSKSRPLDKEMTIKKQNQK